MPVDALRRPADMGELCHAFLIKASRVPSHDPSWCLQIGKSTHPSFRPSHIHIVRLVCICDAGIHTYSARFFLFSFSRYGSVKKKKKKKKKQKMNKAARKKKTPRLRRKRQGCVYVSVTAFVTYVSIFGRGGIMRGHQTGHEKL